MTQSSGDRMETLAILVMLEARPGKTEDLEALLRSALPIAEAEPGTVSWYALKLGPRSFGIFDTFADQAGREAHLNGAIAQALFARADELLAEPPMVLKPEILAGKPRQR
jgi:quinol monooxygenase YgiN